MRFMKLSVIGSTLLAAIVVPALVGFAPSTDVTKLEVREDVSTKEIQL